MSWLRRLFGTVPSTTTPRKHIAILVRGTLWHAAMGADQLKMVGVGGKAVTGIASVFGMPEGLSANTNGDQWVLLSALRGRWILVVPEDSYAVDGAELVRETGGDPLDGRMSSTGAFQLVNVSKSAVDQAQKLVDELPPQEFPPEEPTRVTVGACSACGRDLRMKAHAVRPTVNLTCRCGAKNEVSVAADLLPRHNPK